MNSKFNLRLYLNDGKGNYRKDTTLKLPSNNYNTSTISTNDYDNDGDIDVFVGSRSVPGAYGLAPKIAMITDSEWADINNDKIKDLIITEDWGGVHILINKSGYLTASKTNLNALTGWWKSVKVADIDNDGDVDLVLGNRGTNTNCAADSTSTVKMFTNDFDFNGTIEQIITKQRNGKDIPIHLKRDLTNQLAHLKKENLKFSDYAKKSINDLFSEKKLSQSIQKEVIKSESVIAINDGNYNFKITTLPSRAQLSCINVIEVIDVNNDGYLDIIYGGNDYSLKPQFSQLDASFGGLLLNNRKGLFKWVNTTESGFFVRGVVTSINIINGNKKDKQILLGINDEKPVLFSLNE